jgi:tRNA (guanosine-2'-O-)-methyltransferase
MKDPLSPSEQSALLDYLNTFLSGNKRARFGKIIRLRTRFITLVLEDIFQPHNASAVLRSCDVFGIQDVHIIENRNRYEVNPDVALGASKWLSLYRYNKTDDNTRDCLEKLKKKGYTLVATSPHKEEYTPDTLPLDGKIALLFGTELEGLSATALKMADRFVRIPMFGFTESLNISVSAALLISRLSERLRSSGTDWHLSPEEMISVRLDWARAVIRKATLIEKDFRKKRKN